MARSIVLRFDATCFDCGRSLSAGTTARWFGRGRVSCCGGSAAPAPAPLNGAPSSPAVRPYVPPPAGSVRQPLNLAPANGAPLPSQSPVVPPPYVPVPPWLDRSNRNLYRLAEDTGVPVENLAAGLTPDHVATLATKTPNQRLVVRLSSGARFIVTAQHAAHVLRCVAESMVDRIRDVALLAEGTGD